MKYKPKHIVNYRGLELYLQMRMKLKKVLQALRVDQNAKMKEYIDVKKELRKQPINDFDKEFFKLIKPFRYSTKAFIHCAWKDPGGQRKV